jgi:demethylmenaquinone methyltransferase/2-methoxy-6-polyprenyl-1,4-benzoquinol methylase
MNTTTDTIYQERKDFFDEHAEGWLDMCYRNPETGRLDKHQKDFERLFSLLPLTPGDRVLDAGCGSGVLVPFILERITDSGILYELDFSEKMIETNQRRHAAGNIRFILSEVEKAPLDEAACDMVICFSCFPHFNDKQKAMARLTRILKPNGVFVISHFDSAEGLNRHHESCHAVKHDHMPDEAGMRQLFQDAHLDIMAFVDEPGFYCILAMK